MKRNRRLQGRMVGEVLLLRLNVTLQSVKEFITYSALVNSSSVELLHLKYKDQVYYTLASVCYSFVRWPTKAVAVRLRMLHRSHLKIGYFCDQ